MSHSSAYTEDHIQYRQRLDQALAQYSDLPLAKKRLSYLRWKVVESLDKHLFEFETNVKKTDSTVHWATDAKDVLTVLNKILNNTGKVHFVGSRLLDELSMSTGSKFESTAKDTTDAVVLASKFIVANTGNLFITLDSEEEYSRVLNCRKLVVIAGIDQLLASQNELGLAKMLYATFETGHLRYPFEIMTRPGRPLGMGCEVSVIITDNGRSRVLEHPEHRSLFYLMNFNMPPVCPVERVSEPSGGTQVNSLDFFIFPFKSDPQKLSHHFYMNTGLRYLDTYLPYDSDMMYQVSEARKMAGEQQKKNLVSKVFSGDRKAMLLNPDKYNQYSKFKPYIEELMMGKDFTLQPKSENTFIRQWFKDKRKI